MPHTLKNRFTVTLKVVDLPALKLAISCANFGQFLMNQIKFAQRVVLLLPFRMTTLKWKMEGAGQK